MNLRSIGFRGVFLHITTVSVICISTIAAPAQPATPKIVAAANKFLATLTESSANPS